MLSWHDRIIKKYGSMEDYEKFRKANRIAKYGSEEAFREAQRERGRMATPHNKPRHFQILQETDPHKLKEISKVGGSSGKEKRTS